MKERPIYAVMPVSHLSSRERAYAQRMGILREPQWRSSKPNVAENSGRISNSNNNRFDLGDTNVMPAGDIKSGWGMNVESKTGKRRRIR